MGTIYLTQDAHKILEQLNPPNLRIFELDELKITSARDIIHEAYISEEMGKSIAIIAKIFNIEAQNALLKVLEEPPSGVDFLIFTQNKNALLPTIRSRMLLINDLQNSEIPTLNLDLAHLTLEQVYHFLKSLDTSPSRTQAREIIQSLLKTIQTSNIKLPQKELDFFNKAIQANAHYERIHITLLPILLHLVERK